MKIVKLIKTDVSGYFAVFDIVPELTYEKIGINYIGSAVNEYGETVFSRLLKRESYGGAFGGRELELTMKDGSTETIKDYWYDYGSYKEHGEFMSIGGETLEGLQNCYVYTGYNINKKAFEKMVEEYLSRDKLYDYREVEEWCKLQYEWYDVIVHGKKIPYMMNKFGDMVDKWSKKREFPRYNVMRSVGDDYRSYTYFKFEYKVNNTSVRMESSYLEVLRNTLPYSEEEIRENCKLPPEHRREYLSLNVDELIKRLEKIKNRNKKVKFSVDGKMRDGFRISESKKTLLFTGKD